MKLSNVTIHNFRGIHDASLSLDDYNLLVGPNNAGKSSIIDAIRVFYEKDGFKFRPDRDMPFIAGADQESWVELTFDLSDEEDSSLHEEYRQGNKALRVRKWLKSDDKNKEGLIFAYKRNGDLSDSPFYGAKNVGSGKLAISSSFPRSAKWTSTRS
jgi:predicted ATP-dependent endonuclease of OLD family